MRLRPVILALVIGTALAIPTQARADWLFTPYIGANLGRGGDTLGFDTDNTTVNFGGSLGFMGAGILGFEVDFGYSPHFFETDDVSTLDGNVTSLMGNLIIGIPIGGQTGGGVRPYVSGGAGLMRSRLDDVDDFFDLNDDSFGVNAGGGVMVFFTDTVGLRGDLRWFRSLAGDVDEGDVDLSLASFHFWRASAGVTFRF
jgi:Outer membrane protein beta-barrel domain